MSTTVVLEVTPREPVDPDRHVDHLPADLAALLSRAGQPLNHGLSRHGSRPWRLHFQLSGPDRVRTGQALVEKLRALGYDADLRMSP